MPAILTKWDARHLPLPDESVDLVVTSPPYFNLRSYQDGGKDYDGQIGLEGTTSDYIANLLAATREMVRVLKPDGSIFVNLGDKYADKSLLLLPERYRIACADQLGLTVRSVVIWSKTNPVPESVNDRVRRSHEDWVHLTKSPRYYSDIDALRVPYDGDRKLSRRVKKPGAGQRDQRIAWNGSDKGRIPGSVWEVATQPLAIPSELKISHHAAFPMELPKRFIKGWSRPGGVVLDPFGGTGTTALMADALDRVGISSDMSADYLRIARWRVSDDRQTQLARRRAA